MSVDIDQFIKDQKVKIAAERSYLYKNGVHNDDRNGKSKEDGVVAKMRDGENIHNKYKQELRNEYSIATGLNNHLDSSRKETANETNDGLLHGLRYSNSASKRKEKVRNNEYNEFKRVEEEKFHNRFSSKKSQSGTAALSPPERDNVARIFASNSPERRAPSPPQRRDAEPMQRAPELHEDRGRRSPLVFESKLEELEHKVDDLRNFRMQNPLIVYPPQPQPIAVMEYKVPRPEEPLRYSTTKLGQSHIRYLDDAERRLKEIEDRYSSSKSELLKTYRTKRPMPSILDDERVFEEDKMVRKSLDDRTGRRQQQSVREEEADTGGIIPQSRQNEEQMRRRKQDEYRRDLEQQMRDKEQISRRPPPGKVDEISFFDKFGPNPKVNSKQTVQFAPNDAPKDSGSEYLFYASHNPLDLSPTTVVAAPSAMRPSPMRMQHSYSNPSLAAPSLSPRQQNFEHYSAGGTADKKENYADELKRQIEERKHRKEFEKRKEEEFERRKNQEIADYNPFGKGGGGAPLKDNKGDAVADLRRFLYDDSPRQPQQQQQQQFQQYQHQAAPSMDYKRNVEAGLSARELGDDPSKGYARGGHGIFGQGLTQEDKNKADKYKDELRIQIEEKRLQREHEKETERVREEKEMERIEKQQRELQEQATIEKRQQQEKEAEKQHLLEESRLAALEEKKRQKMERNKIEEREPVEERRHSYKPSHSARSIRVGAQADIQDQTGLEMEASQRVQPSPKPVAREDSRIMDQISALRNQLQRERLTVEQALLRQKDEVEIYDPRLQAPPKKQQEPQSTEAEDDGVFQAVLDKRGPISVRRHKQQKTASKPADREMELDEYLREQERLLARMGRTDFSNLELSMPRMSPDDVLQHRPSSALSRQLESDSDFIRFYQQSADFRLPSADLEHRPQPPVSGSSRPDESSRPGSTASLNIDELTRKNKERLRKLQQLQTDNNDASNTSDADILNRIIASDDDSGSDLFKRRK